MSCTWLLFFVLLHKFSLQRGIIKPIFSDIFTFTLSIFFFARVFHVFSDWLDEKFILMDLFSGNIIGFLKLFFIPQNYLFSLVGSIVGFTIVFLIKTHGNKKERVRYIDAIVWAFLAASLLGYFWSLLGWQVYGIPSSLPGSIIYDHSDTIVKDKAPLFPLAFLYIICITGIIIGMKQLALYKRFPDGFIWYLWIWLFWLMIFLWEFLSGWRKDIFYDYLSLSLNQIGALMWLIFAILWILRLIQKKI
jgi:hypothetical protein